MPEVNAPQQQAPMDMELTSSSSGVVTQQPAPEGQMASEEMSLRGGCTETVDCCGMGESLTCCCG